MNTELLHRTVETFNARRFDEAAALAADALAEATGRDELFWLGLRETCEGFAHVAAGRLSQAQPLMADAMVKLRNFGFRYHDVEVTSVLAGLRRAVEEIRTVGEGRRRAFDMSLLPRIRLSRKADEV